MLSNRNAFRHLSYDETVKPSSYPSLGDDHLISSLLFDAAATRGTLSGWMKENHDGTLNDSTSKKYVYRVSFLSAGKIVMKCNTIDLQ